jgi:flagellar hook-basal body complex protein FliE
MSGFDLPSLPGFDPARLQGMLERFAAQPESGPATPSVQDPERFGAVPGDRARPGRSGDADFGGVLADSIARVNSLQRDVQVKVRGMALGEDVELHDVLVATNKSEVAFNLLLEVRNKLVEAWEKLSRSAV